jgi:hypothetical protein
MIEIIKQGNTITINELVYNKVSVEVADENGVWLSLENESEQRTIRLFNDQTSVNGVIGNLIDLL